MLKVFNSIGYLWFFFCCLACNKNTGSQGQQGTNKTFVIYNAMQYQSMPDLTTRGLRSINLINETSLFTSSTIKTPDSLKIDILATQSSTQPDVPVVLDIEAWSYGQRQLAATIDSFLEVIRIFKQYDKGALGFYGVVPNDAYNWANIEPTGGKNYVNWQNLNSQLSPIADQIDLFFPSFYTDDNDTSSWNEFVTATLGELKKYNMKQARLRVFMATVPRRNSKSISDPGYIGLEIRVGDLVSPSGWCGHMVK
jgi:hypothetical protein